MNTPASTAPYAMVDSHQHFWRLDRGDYGWLTPAHAPIYRDFLPEHLAPQLAQAGVSTTIVVQAAATVAETRFLLDLAREHPFIAGVVGWVDFESATVADTIADLAANPLLVGLRPMIQDIPDPDWMLDTSLAPAFESMLDHGLVFDALVLPQHLPALLELTARYPDLAMVLDHGAKPPIATGNLAAWKQGITALSRATTMVCKLSGLATEAGSVAPSALAPAVLHLLESFGPKRMMWGSDWPVCELVCPYDEWRATSDTLLARLTTTEREQIYSGTARATYGI
ncbi:MAG TPA: amidohydrolase family protein [Steroidobacteraceae bacterium]|nr:amidohydrolase family protein [Steroidobacteraceae bacterium]